MRKAVFMLLSSDEEIPPVFYWGGKKSRAAIKSGELYASRKM